MRLSLKYGLNPHQKNASIEFDGKLPIEVVNGTPGYINLLDALKAYSLAKDLKEVTSKPASASFKHLSPAGAAVSGSLTDSLKRALFAPLKEDISPLSEAFLKARGADRVASFGDFIGLSDICDEVTASLIAREVSDGVIAPGYTDRAREILKGKKGGRYVVLEIDEDYTAPLIEERSVYGIKFIEERNTYTPKDEDLSSEIVSECKDLPDSAVEDLKIALLTNKYAESNSIVYSKYSMAISVAAGGQSRIQSVRLGGDKADRFLLRLSDRVQSLRFKKGLSRNERDNIIESYLLDNSEMDVISSWREYFETEPLPFTFDEKRDYLSKIRGVSLSSDAFFPFSDSIKRASRSGVSYIVEPGGSIRDDLVIKEADRLGITLIFNNVRLFCH